MVGRARRRISVVVPVHNEVDAIEPLVHAISEELKRFEHDYEIVVVNDGATDGTGEVLDRLHAADPQHLCVMHLSRNFGHQAALTAGMDHADGDAIITMDGDMQHPPSVIPVMLEQWEQGYDVVQAVRRDSNEVGLFKELSASLFYALIRRASPTPIERNGCDFRLVSRRVAEVLHHQLRERDRFLRGLVPWIGFRACRVEFDVQTRFGGKTKYSLGKMVSFARTGLVSFSKVPLRMAAAAGLVVSVLSLLYGGYAIFAYIYFHKIVIRGWASTVLVTTFLGGCQLLFLGVIAEYIATIFDEVKRRPLYIVQSMRRGSRLRHDEPCAASTREQGGDMGSVPSDD